MTATAPSDPPADDAAADALPEGGQPWSMRLLADGFDRVAEALPKASVSDVVEKTAQSVSQRMPAANPFATREPTNVGPPPAPPPPAKLSTMRPSITSPPARRRSARPRRAARRVVDLRAQPSRLVAVEDHVPLDEVGRQVGFPLFAKPFDGGGWAGVSRVNDQDALRRVYDDSGTYLLHLQQAVEPHDLFIRCIGFGPQTRLVRYDPSAPLHDRYTTDDGAVPQDQRQQLIDTTLTINSFSVLIVGAPHCGERWR